MVQQISWTKKIKTCTWNQPNLVDNGNSQIKMGVIKTRKSVNNKKRLKTKKQLEKNIRDQIGKHVGPVDLAFISITERKDNKVQALLSKTTRSHNTNINYRYDKNV